MDSFALPAEQAEHLDRLVAGGSEPMGQAGVELRDLAGPHGDVVVGQDQTDPPGEHVQPLVALVGAQVGLTSLRRDDGLPRLDAAGLPALPAGG